MSSQRKAHRFLHRYGPWAVVTGASSGIGRSSAVALAERGLNIVAVARDAQALDLLAVELQERFRVHTQTVPADLTLQAGFDALASATDTLDVGLLVAAAGFGTSGAFLQSDLANELAMVELNCRAVLRQSFHFGRRLAARGRGGMVLLGSLVGFQGVPFSANYAATKAYVQTLAEGLRFELAPHGVDVLSSAPGPVRSGFEARANMRMTMALDPKVVANATLDALGRRTTVAPGLLSWVLSSSLAPLPRPVRSRIMGRIMHGMTKHQ